MIMLLRRVALASICLVVAAIWLAACAASPRTRPLDIGPVAGGPESIEAVRHQLQGTWRLVSFQTFAPGGEATTVPASGELTYDEYGNLVIRGALTGVPGGEQANVLKYSGRAVIDAPNRRLVLQALQGTGGTALPSAVTNDRVRYYAFEADLLKLTVKDDSGRTTATITWKKAS